MDIYRICWGCGSGLHHTDPIELLSNVAKYNEIEKKPKLRYRYKDLRLCRVCYNPYLYLKAFN